MGRRKIRGLKARVGLECCISRRGARLNNGGIQAEGEGSHSAGRCGISRSIRDTAPGRRAAKSSESREGE